MADFIADYDGMGGFPENAEASDPEARITTLQMYAADGSGGVSRFRLISGNMQTTIVYEVISFTFVDRPVTVSSVGWSDDMGTDSPFSIDLNEGWNTVLRRAEVTMSPWSANLVSTTIANPDNMRWYWEDNYY